MTHAHTLTIFFGIFLVLSSLGMWYCTLMLARNEKVYSYRLRLIDRISERNKDEISRGMGYDGWRNAEFRSVSYHAMVFKFWKPLKSFYEKTKLEKELYE